MKQLAYDICHPIGVMNDSQKTQNAPRGIKTVLRSIRIVLHLYQVRKHKMPRGALRRF